jgi:hypothetical protein
MVSPESDLEGQRLNTQSISRHMTTIRAARANKPAITASIHAAALRDIEAPCTKNMAREAPEGGQLGPQPAGAERQPGGRQLEEQRAKQGHGGGVRG